MQILQTRTGFTLMELLAVVMIVAVLSGMAIGTYRQAAERSHFNEGLQIGAAMTEAINRYYNEHLELSVEARKSPTLAQLDISFTGQGECKSVSSSIKPYCAKGRYFEVYYSTNTNAIYAYRVKENARSDYSLVFYPDFHSTRALEKCVVVEKNGTLSATGKSICKSMGYTELDSGSTTTFRKPYGKK